MTDKHIYRVTKNTDKAGRVGLPGIHRKTQRNAETGRQRDEDTDKHKDMHT